MQIGFVLLDPYSIKSDTCSFLFGYLLWIRSTLKKSLSFYLLICPCARLRRTAYFSFFFGANFSSNQLERLSVVHRSQVDIGRVNFCLLCFYFRLQFITYLLTVFKLKLCYGLNLKCKTSLN